MVLYPEFEFVLLFDHNQGHACKRHGALNALQMSQNYGETQPHERNDHNEYNWIPCSSLNKSVGCWPSSIICSKS
jgi:hypothetical protein